MSGRWGRRVVAPVVALGLAVAACGEASTSNTGDSGGSASKGDAPETIVLGTSGSMTGSYAAEGLYMQGAEAYFDHVNSEGGVLMADGVKRKIVWKTYDDQYDPARTLSNCRRFVEQDKGFAMVMVKGTPPGQSCREYLAQQNVPSVFHNSAALTFSTNRDEFPLTSGFPLSYTTETAIIAEALKDLNPDARIGMLLFKGDAGLEYRNGLHEAISGSESEIVIEENYSGSDTSVNTPMAKILQADVDTFVQFTAGAAVSQALNEVYDSKKEIINFLVSSGATTATVGPAGAAAKGVLAVQWLKDPSNPQFADDPAVAMFRERVLEFTSGGKDGAKDYATMIGYVGAQLIVDALSRSEPTAESFMDAIYSFDEVSVDGLLDGITVTTGPDDPFLIEAGLISEYDGSSWVVGGDVYSYEGRSPTLDES